jgi:hypothetical protein
MSSIDYPARAGVVKAKASLFARGVNVEKRHPNTFDYGESSYNSGREDAPGDAYLL